MTIHFDESALQRRYAEMSEVEPIEQEKQPGRRAEMVPKPDCGEESYIGSNKLLDKVAIITGGDSGIGRAVAIAFAREGADVAIIYKDELSDAEDTQRLVEQSGRRASIYAADIGEDKTCKSIIKEIASSFGRIDCLVNNAAEQHMVESIEDLSREQVEQTFRTNIFSFYSLTSAVIPHMRPWSTIVNSTSVTAYRGSSHLPVYAGTKGAIVAFTRSLATSLVEKGIRVNAVAPGPVWTPLIPASMPGEKMAKLGEKLPIGRRAQPAELAPAYVYLASADSSYVIGQVLHVNGGTIIGG